MNKEELIEEFFRALRITLTTAFSYPKTHPYFIKSAENFKSKLEAAQAVLNPLQIGVTDTELLLGQESFDFKGLSAELARLLHQRKVKSLTIKNGASLAEVIGFFSVISMSPKDILRQGGVNHLLTEQSLHSFMVEDLDYSVFLHNQGQECSDLWGYLLKDMLAIEAPDKLNTLAANFNALIKQSSQNDIFNHPEVTEQISQFLLALKAKDQALFTKCSQELFVWLLHNKQSLNADRLGKLKAIFEQLDQEELGRLFLEGVNQEENFDTLSLEIFSKLAQQKNPGQITSGFLNKLQGNKRSEFSPKVARRLNNLLVGLQNDRLSAVYRHTLELLVKGIASSGALTFDQKELKENYRYIVLNILAVEEDRDNLQLAALALEKELSDILNANELGLLKDIGSTLLRRKKTPNAICGELEKTVSFFVENFILSQPLAQEQEFLLDLVTASSQDINFYLDKIFGADLANKHILSLFFKFFPGHLDIFYQRFQGRVRDIEFTCSLIQALSSLNSVLTLGILDHIYASVNELVKIEILHNLRKLKRVDAQFLLRQLNTPSPTLRKNLLALLVLDVRAQEEALELLLKKPGWLGQNNSVLIENMQIVFELGLIEAAGLIRDLSRRQFFWNSKLRAKARQILKEWNVN